MKLFAAAVLLLAATDLRAAHRIVLTPSLEMTQVNDDNLNASATDPLRDDVQRVTPGLALKLESQRTAFRLSLAAGSERYVNRPSLNDDRAREHAGVGVRFRATPRLELAFDGDYAATNTLADLNVDTALAAARIRGRQTSARPSATFHLSPTIIARAATSSVITTAAGGIGVRAEQQTLGIERQLTPRDTMTADVDHAVLAFTGDTTLRVHTAALIFGWTHDFNLDDRLVLRGGPRRTDGASSADLSASWTHTIHRAAFGLSLSRAQTTVVGFAAPLQTDSVQTNVSWTPLHDLTLFAGPGVFRSASGDLVASVARLSCGVRYTITSFLQAQVAYNRDAQNGAINPLQAHTTIQRSTLSFGLVTRPNIREVSQ